MNNYYNNKNSKGLSELLISSYNLLTDSDIWLAHFN